MTNDRERQMEVKAKQLVLASTSWFTQAELANSTNMLLSEIEPHLLEWKSSGMLFSVHHEGAELFPSYAFNHDEHLPMEELKLILSLFAGKKDGWGVAYWFASLNGYLGGKCPQDMLQVDPKRVSKAAEIEIAGVIHG